MFTLKINIGQQLKMYENYLYGLRFAIVSVIGSIFDLEEETFLNDVF